MGTRGARSNDYFRRIRGRAIIFFGLRWCIRRWVIYEGSKSTALDVGFSREKNDVPELQGFVKTHRDWHISSGRRFCIFDAADPICLPESLSHAA